MATSVVGGFNALLADLDLTDPQQVIAEARVAHLDTWFRANIPCADYPFKIGSYDRGTVIRWRRDVDVMAALAFDPYWARYGSDSAAMLYWLRGRLNDAYGDTTVSTRQVAIRMALGAGIQVDLVPGFARRGGGYLIPDGSGGWMATNPPYHASIMTDANLALDVRLKPLVRVMKAWNEANTRHLRSFHLEMMVWEMWHEKALVPPLPEAVSQTLDRLAGIWLRSPMWDPWKDAGAKMIDAYLSDAERGVVERLAAADHKRAGDAIALDRAGRVAEAFAKWGTVFNGRFPAYG